jgi:plastocyanin
MRSMATLLILASASPAFAVELTVDVRLANGAPVRNAVVSLYPGGRPAPLAAARTTYRVAQQNIQFSPFVLVVPIGGEVAFPNLDSFRHHVYSFSPAKRFELKLYAKEQNRSVRFDKAGVVALGCNIHDSMTAFVKVSDTGFAVKTDASGKAVFANAPAGLVVARVWHPYLRAPANQLEAHWNLARTAQQRQAVTVNLRPAPRPTASY